MKHLRFAYAARLLYGLAVAGLATSSTFGQMPNHPIITEVYTDPNGTSDGPVGRDPGNAHQEFFELYLPTAATLSPTLNKDALRLAFYEVEGDSTSTGNGLVNYRVDLPTFDLDPSNGMTPGAVQRPTSGIVVLAWVDYVGNPPTGLAGTPSTRVALVNGGVTSTTGYTVVALNGGQFSGTTNYPIPAAISSIDMPGEASSGIIQNGSGAYLLVNRDAAGYVQLYDDENIPSGGSADPDLPAGTVLQTSCFLDGLAGNDHSRFDVIEQPYAAPTGEDIDLENVLPQGGAFSMLVPQVPERASHGYTRVFVDEAKTTDDADPGNHDPVADALGAYLNISNAGPFFPTPGRAASTTSPPELSLASAAAQTFEVLAATTGRPGLSCANIGGHYAIELTASPGTSSNPSVATLATGSPALIATGQTLGFPTVAVTVPAAAAHGAVATAGVTVTAANVSGGDPPVVAPVGATTASVVALNPLQGQNALGQPFQGTAFVALHGIPDQPGLPNEFAGTSLSSFVAQHLGGLVDDERHNGAALIDPATDLSDPVLADAMEDDMPADPEFFINTSGAPGRSDLVTTILNSAEVQAGNGTYQDNFDGGMTAVRAVKLDIAETRTSGGAFVPTERVHFADARGLAGAPTSGLSGATSARGFELALLDTNVQQAGTLETGQTDDFGLVVRVGRTRAGSPLLPDQLVFLSFTGGLEGADVDSIDVPPHGNQTVIIYLDLENLDSVLGVETITQLIVVDGSGSSALNVIEAFSLNVRQQLPYDADDDGDVDLADYSTLVPCITGPTGVAAANCLIHDPDHDSDVDLRDLAGFQRAIVAP